ncbi:DUF2169 domain-containing protein [Sorangium sp. So ce1099]|uniref:DUF2169 domain-containing protein n=1 Tax=Sorangium sp. So ce1099 TaxID=3133331 RepID=UPI003F5D6C28
MPSWPLPVIPLNPVRCGSVLWKSGDRLRVTVIVKAALGLSHERVAWPIAPVEIAHEDSHAGDLPTSSLETASELSPYLPGAGVVLTGCAYAPDARPITSMTVRLGLFRGSVPVIDKRIHVFGDRSLAAPQRPRPFRQMPLVYERACASAAENPAGVPAAADASALPNLLDPAQPARPIGFGPISPRWPARRRLLGGIDPRSLCPPATEIPEGFDWRYFHAAPPDQQVDLLRGDEWLVLDGLHPWLPRLQTQLPSARALARRYIVGPGGPGPVQPIELRADTLLLDVERQIGALVWRGHFDLEHLRELPESRVFAGLELPGRPIAWPTPDEIAWLPSAPEAQGELRPSFPATDPAPAARPSSPSSSLAAATTPPASQPSSHAVDPSQQTYRLSSREIAGYAQRPIAPFALPLPGARAPTATRPIPGAPWSSPGAAEESPPPAAPGDPWLETTVDACFPAREMTPSSVEKAPVSRSTEPPVSRSTDSVRAPAPPPAQAPAPAPSNAQGAAPPAGDPPAGEPEGALRAAVLARLRAREPLDGLHLAGADLSGLDLRGASLARLNLEGASLRGCALAHAQLAEARLAGADLSEADLTGADLSRADLSRADLSRAVLEGARLDDARGEGATFDGARLSGARAKGASLIRCSCKDAEASGSSWQGARLDETSFAGANLERADLSRAICPRVVLAGASAAGINLQRAQAERADLRGARLEGADLRHARLTEARLDGAVLRSALAHRADLGQCRLVRADLTGASLRACRLRGANLSFARLEGADLRDAELDGANVHGAERRGVKLSKVDERRLVEIPPGPDGGPGEAS